MASRKDSGELNRIKVDVSSLRGTDSYLTAHITGGRGACLVLSFVKHLEEPEPAVRVSANSRGIRHVVGQLCETEIPRVIKELTEGELALEVVDQEEDDCSLKVSEPSKPAGSRKRRRPRT